MRFLNLLVQVEKSWARLLLASWGMQLPEENEGIQHERPYLNFIQAQMKAAALTWPMTLPC
jgi:hypothetical protein